MTDREGNDHSSLKGRRIGLWLLGGAILVLCTGHVLWVKINGDGGGSERWMAEMRAQGERFTLAEIFPQGFGDPATNRSSDLYRLIDALSEPPLQFGGASMREAGPGVAAPYWKETRPHNIDKSVTNDWVDLYLSADADHAHLVEIYRLLSHPDQDLGDALHIGSKVRPDFVRKRSLAQQLCGVVTIELNRGNSSAAAAALDGLRGLPRWHWQHSDLVNYMIGVAMRNLTVEAQWAALQFPGWSDEKLFRWHEAWRTNRMLPQLELAAQVERARALEAFEFVATNTTDWRSVIGSPATDHLRELVRSTFLEDQDKMLTLRFHQIALDATRVGIRERSRAAHRRVYAARAKLETEWTRGWGSLCTLSHSMCYRADTVVDAVFEYETRREMLTTAIALRRFHRAKGSFPETLKELIPGLIEEEPVDWMNGGKLYYRRGANGWFHLRSFGENGLDDLGAGDDLPWWQTPEQRRQAGP